MVVVEIDQWQMPQSLREAEQGRPIGKPLTTLVEVDYSDGTRTVLRRFDISSLPELIQLSADDFSIDPPAVDSYSIKTSLAE